MRDPRPVVDLIRAGVLDGELAALLWLLLEARTPLVAVGEASAGDRVIDGLSCLLPEWARVHRVVPDDDFAWLPEAGRLGWQPDGTTAASGVAAGAMVSADDGVILARALAAPDGVAGERARVVVRALAIGYGLLATMPGQGLDDVFAALHDPAVGTDADERSRLGVVLAVADAAAGPRVTAAHYVCPVALDTHGHVQRPGPAVLATWNPSSSRYDHFAWGVLSDLAGRTGMTPAAFEREQAGRASALSDPFRDVHP